MHQGKQLSGSFISGPKCIFFSNLRGLGGGGIQLLDSAYLGLKLSSHPYLYVHVK